MIAQRPLNGLRVALSISESDDTSTLGFPPSQVNRVVAQFATALLGQGATTLFGHDWREDGVMEAIHAAAQTMQPPRNTFNEAQSEPLLQNFIAWPDKPALPLDELERLRESLRVTKVDNPPGLVRWPTTHSSPLEYEYLRARALTRMRREISLVSHACVCIGGRVISFQGRYPGIIEEAVFALRNERALFLVGALGGATREIIETIEQRRYRFTQNTDEIQQKRVVYDSPEFLERNEDPDDAIFDFDGVHEQFRRHGLEGLASRNRLSVEENLELFRTPSIERALQLVLIGLSRIKYSR